MSESTPVLPESTPVEIVFNLPTKSTPGYLRRMREAAEVRARAAEGSPEAVDTLVSYLAQFVASGAGRDQAVELLYEASEEQLEAAFAFLNGSNPTK